MIRLAISPREEKEKVYFVVDERYLRRFWPELLRAPFPFDPDAVPERLVSGIDCWVVQTWARLSRNVCSFEPVLTTQAVTNAVCLFHRDSALPGLGVHRCFAVVAQADRVPPPLADIVVVQNNLLPDTDFRRFIPHWPQPGLLPRDACRGTGLEILAYLGSEQYIPDFMRSDRFRAALRHRHMRLDVRLPGNWHDYREIDAVLAIRKSSPLVLATKPVSKLVNAWAAGVPALLGDEPAYRRVRQSPLDYLEVASGDHVLERLDQLTAEPGLYREMVANGQVRAKAFSAPAVTACWIAVLEEALRLRRMYGPTSRAVRRLRYAAYRFTGRMGARIRGWKD